MSAAGLALLLWYQRPAANWNEALPLGDGRLGAMIFGGVQDERLQINESTLWQGGTSETDNPQAYAQLKKLREAIFNKDPQSTEEAASKMLGRPPLLQPYQPFCDLRLHFPGHQKASDYRRELDLDQATARVQYKVGEVKFSREVFVSHPDQVLVVRLSADKPGALSFDAALDSPQAGSKTAPESSDTLNLSGRLAPRMTSPEWSWSAAWPKPGLKYQGTLKLRFEGGTSRAKGDILEVRGADTATLIFSGATSFKKYNDVSGNPAAIVKASLKAVESKDFEALKKSHLSDFQSLFGRLSLDLGNGFEDKPTDWRVKHFSAKDPGLAALYCQFGRYLLISCSRPGGQPANLQGIWNQDLWPAWSSKMTTNINLEMNYWPAETGNLAECQEPLYDLIDDLRVTGAKTAKIHYHARGFVLHHNTDLWRATTPVDGSWGLWPMGAVWLCQHLWDHYEFSGDRKFLKERAYPAMKEAARFVLDFLVEAPKGTPFAGMLVTNPSFSPENRYFLSEKKAAALTYAASMDLELIDDLFDHCLEASRLLGVDAMLRKEIESAKRRLPPLQIGARGQLQEWIEDYKETEPDHRHVSHLYALYPGDKITPDVNPKFSQAAKKSLELRGDGGTGWAKAWKVGLWARLKEGNRAYKVLEGLISKSTLPNLFDVCPPFQIDGNFGGAAGMMELLLQSQGGTLRLLPALPGAWPRGSVKGLQARGGFTVDLEWKRGKLVKGVVRSKNGGTCRLEYGGQTKELKTVCGSFFYFDSKLNINPKEPAS